MVDQAEVEIEKTSLDRLIVFEIENEGTFDVTEDK
jgi:hypothetical protein